MKLWKGKKRIAKKIYPRAFNKIYNKEYNFFINLKPGDLYYGCDGFNHRLREKEIEYIIYGKTKVVCRIELLGEDEGFHNFPNCAWLPRSKQEILNKWFGWAKDSEGLEAAKEWGWSNFVTKLIAGEELLDNDGVLLDPNWRD